MKDGCQKKKLQKVKTVKNQKSLKTPKERKKNGTFFKKTEKNETCFLFWLGKVAKK